MPEFVLPDNFETYPEARKKAFLTMKELKEQGRRIVGVFCTYTPWELINAADAATMLLNVLLMIDAVMVSPLLQR